MDDYWEGPTYMGGLPSTGPFEMSVTYESIPDEAIKFTYSRQEMLLGYDVTAKVTLPCGHTAYSRMFVSDECYTSSDGSPYARKALGDRVKGEALQHRCAFNRLSQPILRPRTVSISNSTASMSGHTAPTRKAEQDMSYDEYRSGLLSAMASAAEELARLDSTPDLSEMANGTVLYARREFGTGSQYDYVYLKAAGQWYATGQQGRTVLSDQDLRRTLARDSVREISVVSEWQILYGEPAKVEDDES